MSRPLLCMLSFACALESWAQPRVAVLPFDAVMDSAYRVFEGKESILDYQRALQTMITTELSKLPDIRVVEVSEITKTLRISKTPPAGFNDLASAAAVCDETGADLAIIGSYGEYSREIRVDARVYVNGMNEIPPGNVASATAKLWEDLPTAVERLAVQLASVLRTSVSMRPVSVGRLYPEGTFDSYGLPAGGRSGTARLVVWVNAPAPEVTTMPAVEFRRCGPIDRVNVPEVKQKQQSCHFATIDSGQVRVRVNHRGFVPFEQSFDLDGGKVYRLEVRLVEARFLGR